MSAYEFAIEEAASTIDVDTDAFLEGLNNTPSVITLSVWPWSHLVPWFRRNIQMVSSNSLPRLPLSYHMTRCIVKKMPGQPPRGARGHTPARSQRPAQCTQIISSGVLQMAVLKEEEKGPESFPHPLWETHYDDARNRTYFWNTQTKMSVWRVREQFETTKY